MLMPMAISMIGASLRRDTVLLMGWFGPRGLASVVFGLLAVASFNEADLIAEPLSTIITLTVLLSVFAHGFSARPLVNWYANRLDKAQDAHMELEEVPEMRVRSSLMGPPGVPRD